MPTSKKPNLFIRITHLKHLLNRFLLIFFLSILLISFSKGQEKKPLFMGLQPAITQERNYEKDEFDVNVFPLVFQMGISKQFDIRFTSIVNYHIGNENGFSDIGLNTVVPYFFKRKEDRMAPSSGIYLGPALGLGNNFLDDHGTVTLAAEGGYMFPATKRFTLALSMQLGGSYFVYSDQPNSWTNHFGIKINLGWWLRKD